LPSAKDSMGQYYLIWDTKLSKYMIKYSKKDGEDWVWENYDANVEEIWAEDWRT